MFIQKNVLIVNEEKAFITTCEEILGEEEFVVWAATSIEKAVAIVEQEFLSLAILGLALSDAEADPLLKALDNWQPLMPLIMCHWQSDVSLAILSRITQTRPVAFLEKPCQNAPLKQTVSRFFRRYTSEHVRGNLNDLSLISLITANCNEGNTSAVEIWHEGKRGVLFFDMGQITHAETAHSTGEAAVYEIIGWQGGEFVLHMNQSVPAQSIFVSWSNVLLEGLRLLDEQEFDEEGMTLQEDWSTDEMDEMDEMNEMDEMPAADFGLGTEEGLGDLDWGIEDPLIAAPPPKSADIDAETQDKIEVLLDELFHELSLRCLIFARQSGRMLYSKGSIGESRLRSLAALIAGSFSADNEIAVKLALEDEDTQQFQQSLQEGTDFSLYTAQVKPDWILAVVFEPSQINLGFVRQFTRRAGEELEIYIAENEARQSEQDDWSSSMNDSFRQEVGDALGDLFS